MSIIPKKHLEWREPKVIREARAQDEKRLLSPWFKPGAFLIIVANILFVWWVGKQAPNNNPLSLPAAVAASIAAGIFFVFGIPWLLSLCPSYVRILDYGINRVIGNTAALWKFKDIDHCEITAIAEEEGGISALVIHTIKGKRIVLGVPEGFDNKLTEVLSEFDVKIR